MEKWGVAEDRPRQRRVATNWLCDFSGVVGTRADRALGGRPRRRVDMTETGFEPDEGDAPDDFDNMMGDDDD